MKEKLRIFFIFFLLFILTACTRPSVNKVKYSDKAKYVSIHQAQPGISLVGKTNMLVFYDNEGKILENYKFEVDTYISKGIGQYIFFYGKSGILRIDKKNKIVERITDLSSDAIDFENGKLYHNINGGFVNYPHPKYKESICEFGGECINFDTHLATFRVLKDKLYVQLNQYNEETSKQWYVLRVYDFKTKELLSEAPMSHLASIEKASNTIYILDENDKLYNFETKELVFDLGKYIENQNIENCYNEWTLENNYNGDLVIRIRKEDKLVLFNITKQKEEISAPRAISLNFSPSSKTVVSENMGEDTFTDLSNNKTFKLKDFGKSYISSYIFPLD